MRKWISVAMCALLPALLHAQAPKAETPTAAPAAATGPMSIEDFVKLPSYTRMSVSPSGKYLAVKMPYEETTIVAVIDRTTSQRTAAIHA